MASAFLPAFVTFLMKAGMHELPPQRYAGGIATSGSSYPSGHVVGLAVVAGLVFVYADDLVPNWLGAWALRSVSAVVMVSVGFSRIWNGTHWPTDVLASYLLAALFLITALKVSKVLRQR